MLKKLTWQALENDPGSLLYLNSTDPLILKLEMLRLLEVGYPPQDICRVFNLESTDILDEMLAQVKTEGTSHLLDKGKAPIKTQQMLWTDDTKGQICAAAVQVLYAQGYHGSTMRDIAELAGIRAPSIYNHFATKEALLAYIMELILLALRERVVAALEVAPDDPAQRLATFVREHIQFHVEYAPEAKVADNELSALGEKSRKPILALRDQYESLLRELLQTGVAQGVFDETNIKLASIAILTMCTAVTVWYQPDGPLSTEEIARAYIQFVLRMVGS